jgi:hypothetical protein
MRRSMRALSVLAVALAGIAVVALPAQAKGPGEHDNVEGLAVIVGPGLSSPLQIKGQVDVYEGGVSDDFGQLFAASGLRPYDLTVDGWYDLEPKPGTLGPRYQVTWTFADEEFSTPIVQDVYPYAQGGRPWFFSHPHQFSPLFGSRPVPSAWWSAPGWVLGLLGRNGLPTVAPRPDPVVQPAGHPLPAVGLDPWVLGIALTGMLVLVLVGVGVGRRQSVRTL